MRTTIYISPRVRDSIKKVAEREGSDVSASNIWERLGARFGALHFGGNPQLSLLNYVGHVGFTCFHCDKQYDTLMRVEFVSGLVAPTCNDCLEENRLTVTRVLGGWRRGDKVRYRKKRR